MATFVLIHGGGGSSWDWHLLVPELTRHGHDVVVPELPIEDPAAGFTEFRDTVVTAIGDRSDLVVVGHSYGAFTAPLIAAELPVRLVVLLTPMIPKPGESPGDWWDNTGHHSEEGLSQEEQFFGGVPAEVVAQAAAHGRDQAGAEWNEPWPLDTWPDVPTRVLIARDDRFFPPAFQCRVAAERLGVTPDEIDGCHAVALSHPRQLADRLTAYLAPDPGVPDLDVTKVLAASPEQIFAAWSDPAAIARWWGPEGFTSTVRELDVRPGGRFDVVMRGPDGAEFANVYVFADVEAGRRVTYVHQGSAEHGLAPSRSVMTIEEEEDAGVPRTRVTLRSFYASDTDRRRHLEDFQAVAGARQLLDRLERVAATLVG